MKEIPLTQGKVALVDDEDYERLMAMGRWYTSTGGYAQKSIHLGYGENGNRLTKTIRMHREIMNVDSWAQVDHINGNILDNRRENLRVCTKSENMRNRKLVSKNNTTGFKGVSLCRATKKFIAQISVDNKVIYLGRFTTTIDAAKCYNQAAIKYHGEFAKLNPL